MPATATTPTARAVGLAAIRGSGTTAVPGGVDAPAQKKILTTTAGPTTP